MKNLCLLGPDEDSKEIERVARSLHPAGGVIIVLIKDGSIFYWSTNEFPSSFGNPTRSDDPIVYYRLSAARKKMERVRAEYSKYGVCLAMWIHPDAGVPLNKYMRITGGRFPGSPRR